MIGLDISDRSIKIAEVSKGGTALSLRTACWSPLAPKSIRRGVIQDLDGLAAALQDALHKCSGRRIQSTQAVVSIPEVTSFVRLINLPEMSSGEMGEAVQWAIRQHIPFDLDSVYLDWQVVPAISDAAKRKEVLVGVAQRSVVDSFLSVVDRVGLQAIALELESQALVRSLLPRDANDVRGVLLIDLGAVSTTLIYFDKGAPRFVTTLQQGGDDITTNAAAQLHVDTTQAAELKAVVGTHPTAPEQAGAAEVLHTVARDLVQQISTVVTQSLTRLGGETAISTIVLAGGAANMPGMTEVVNEVFPEVPVHIGNPLINLSVEESSRDVPLSASDAVHFSTAIGLALRPVVEAEPAEAAP